jgi:uncharacterized repeat protein (TIGR01451 family)
MKNILLAIALVVIVSSSKAQTVLYVNPTATGANNGSSWNNGFTNLQHAIDAATNGNEIWVKAGIYSPGQGITGTDFYARYTIVNKNISLYGGFSGTEISKSQRISNNYSALSGQFYFPTDPNSKIETVLEIKNSNQVLLDGFTGQKANTLMRIDTSNVTFSRCLLDTNFSHSSIRIGKKCHLEFRNCRFENYNQGNFLISGENSVLFDHCAVKGINSTFLTVDNGMSIQQEMKLTVYACRFENNQGALFIGDSIDMKFDSCSFLNLRSATTVCRSAAFSNCLVNAGSYFEVIAKNLGDSTLVVNNCTFRSVNGGNHLLISYGASIIRNCLFSHIRNYYTLFAQYNINKPFSGSNIIVDSIAVTNVGDIRASDASLVQVSLYKAFASYLRFITNDMQLMNISIKNSTVVLDANSGNYNVSKITMDSCENASLSFTGNNNTTNTASSFRNISVTNSSYSSPTLRFLGPLSIMLDSVTCISKENQSQYAIYKTGSKDFYLRNITIMNQGGYYSGYSTKGRIENSRFLNISGGGNFAAVDSMYLLNCVFENNKGRAFSIVANSGAGKVFSQNNRFKNNAGALFCVGNLKSFGDLFYNNKAAQGSALHLLDSAQIFNASFVLNHNQYIYSETDSLANVVLYNSLFHLNTGNHVGIDSAYHCILPDFIPGPNNIIGDAKINLQFQPLPMSPAINAGLDISNYLDSVPTYDVAGHLRVQHGVIDIGAIEADSIQQYNLIKGNVIRDFGQNCITESLAEKGIPGVIIAIQPGNIYTSTDTAGTFEAPAEVGTYTVKQILSDQEQTYLTPLCPTPSEFQVSFSQLPDTSISLDFFNEIQTCSHLTVHVGASRRVRCFKGFTIVQYCNEGNLEASNVRVKVDLPEFVVPLSANLSYDTLDAKTLIFPIGNIPAGHCGIIHITDSIACEMDAMNATQCVTAEISPKSSCIQESPLWDKSEIKLKPMCAGNTAVFRLHNIGTGDMLDSTEFRIYFDTLLGYQNKLMIKSKDSITIEVMTNGQTIFLEVDQRPSYPGDSIVRTFVESCSDTSQLSSNPPRIGLPISKPPIPTVSSSSMCSVISGSFDPNEKLVTPAGIGSANNIYPHEKLEYTIHFQNTGTDTAYTILISDTLSPYLDLSTLEMGVASHPHTYSISGKGSPVLNWKFDNINLPDSNRNERQSHGFVTFSIQQKNTTVGTIIKNKAAIYFDYNEPVITNETSLEIWNGELVDFSLGSRVNLNLTSLKNPEHFVASVSPNPSTGSFRFTLPQHISGLAKIVILDIQGNVQTESNFVNSSEVDLSGLPKGMYYYRIQSSEGHFANGKLILY